MTVVAAQPRPEKGLSERGYRGLSAGTLDRVSRCDPGESPIEWQQCGLQDESNVVQPRLIRRLLLHTVT